MAEVPLKKNDEFHGRELEYSSDSDTDSKLDFSPEQLEENRNAANAGRAVAELFGKKTWSFKVANSTDYYALIGTQEEEEVVEAVRKLKLEIAELAAAEYSPEHIRKAITTSYQMTEVSPHR